MTYTRFLVWKTEHDSVFYHMVKTVRIRMRGLHHNHSSINFTIIMKNRPPSSFLILISCLDVRFYSAKMFVKRACLKIRRKFFKTDLTAKLLEKGVVVSFLIMTVALGTQAQNSISNQSAQ